MGDAEAPPAARAGAARIVLDAALRATELEDLARRLAAIETRLNGAQG